MIKHFRIALLGGLLLASLVTYYNFKPKYYQLHLPPIIRYVELTHNIMDVRRARPQDIIFMRTDTAGGSSLETKDFIDEIRDTPALVLCTVHYDTYSAGAYISAACSNVFVNPRALVMFHVAQVLGMPAPPGSKAHKDSIELAKKIRLKQLLTEEEYKRYIAGEDVYILGRELIKRQPWKYKELLR